MVKSTVERQNNSKAWELVDHVSSWTELAMHKRIDKHLSTQSICNSRHLPVDTRLTHMGRPNSALPFTQRFVPPVHFRWQRGDGKRVYGAVRIRSIKLARLVDGSTLLIQRSQSPNLAADRRLALARPFHALTLCSRRYIANLVRISSSSPSSPSFFVSYGFWYFFFFSFTPDIFT